MVAVACVANTHGRKLLISDLLYRVKLHGADPEFVGICLRSPWSRYEIESSIRTDAGQTLKIRSDDLKNLVVPNATMEVQVEAKQAWHEINDITYRLFRTLQLQIDLLREHRQALITAAVTGELDVPVVAA